MGLIVDSFAGGGDTVDAAINQKLETPQSSPHFSSQSSTWATPWAFFRKQAAKYGPFDLDVCAEPETAKCERYFTKEDDGLSQHWHGVCWMNPPYGREIHKWVLHAWREACFLGHAKRVVCLLPSRTDTTWWHDYVLRYASAIEYIRGRIKFEGAKFNAPFPSAIVVFEKTEVSL